ncbi:unnamed protein product [Closterium sp. NIES-64]|nr:unnamed protein product [Closterium sp. NIES-64]
MVHDTLTWIQKAVDPSSPTLKGERRGTTFEAPQGMTRVEAQPSPPSPPVHQPVFFDLDVGLFQAELLFEPRPVFEADAVVPPTGMLQQQQWQQQQQQEDTAVHTSSSYSFPFPSVPAATTAAAAAPAAAPAPAPAPAAPTATAAASPRILGPYSKPVWGQGWSSLRLCLQRIKLCHVSSLAGNPSARFLMLRHGEATVWAACSDWWGYGEQQHGHKLSIEACDSVQAPDSIQASSAPNLAANKLTSSPFTRLRREQEFPVLSTWQDAIGRGSGAPGGNPLERGEAGVCLLLVQWPGRCQEASVTAGSLSGGGKKRGVERGKERVSPGGEGGGKGVRGSEEGRESEGLVYVCVRGLTAELPGGRWDFFLPLSTLLPPQQRPAVVAASAASTAAGSAAAGENGRCEAPLRVRAVGVGGSDKLVSAVSGAVGGCDRGSEQGDLWTFEATQKSDLWINPARQQKQQQRRVQQFAGQGGPLQIPSSLLSLPNLNAHLLLNPMMSLTCSLISRLTSARSTSPPDLEIICCNAQLQVDTCQDSMQVLGRLGQQVQLVFPPDAPLVPPGGVTSRVYGGGEDVEGQTGQGGQGGQGGQQVQLVFPPDTPVVPPGGVTGRMCGGGGVVEGQTGQGGQGGQQVQLVFPPDAPVVPPGGVTSRVYGGGGVAGGHVGQGGEGREGGEGGQGGERGEGGQRKGADAAADAAAAPPAAAASAATAAAAAAAAVEGRDVIGSNGWKIGIDAGLRLIEEEAGGWVDVIVPEQSGGEIGSEVDYNEGWTWMEVESGGEKHAAGYSHIQKGEGCPSSNRWSREGAKTGGSSNTSGQFHAHLHPPYSHLDSNRSRREVGKTGSSSSSSSGGAHQSHHATWLEDISGQLVPDHVPLVPPSSLQNIPSCCSSSSSLPSAMHSAPSSSPSPSSPSHSSPSPSSPPPSAPFTSRPSHKPSSLPASYPPSEARILLRNCSLVCRLSSGRHFLSSSAAVNSGLCVGLCAAPGATGTAGAGAGAGGAESAWAAAESASAAAESAARLRLEGPCMEVILRGVDVQIDKFQPHRLQVPPAAGVVDDSADAASAVDGIASAAADAAATAADSAPASSHTAPTHTTKRESVYTSRVAVTVREIGVWDRGLQQGQQGLGQGQNGQGQQQGGRRWARVGGAYGREAADVRSKALRLLLDAVRPNPTVEIDEFRLSVALLPIRLRMDQNHIEFLSSFTPSLLYFLCSLSFFPALQALSGSAANPPAHGLEPHRIPLTLHSLSALLPLLPLVLPCSAGSQLSVALLPIRLRMDQNHIEFLSSFTPSLLYFLCSLSFFPALQALSGSAANPPAHGLEPHRIPLTLHSLSALLPLLPLVLPCSAGSQLSVALLPIRLRMDQNHIEFLSRFTPSLLYFLCSLSFFPALQALSGSAANPPAHGPEPHRIPLTLHSLSALLPLLPLVLPCSAGSQLSVALLPIRLRMDQNHIEFLSRFTPSLLYFLCSLSFFPALQALSGSAANPPAHGPEPHRIPLTLHSLSALLPSLPLVLPCSAGSQLSVALLPIRLRMDQNHIEFLSRFTPSLLYFLCSLSFFPALQALSGSAANPPAHGPEPHRIPLTLHSLSALLPLLPLVLPCSAGSQLSVALLPIRLRMDQNHIEFLSRFTPSLLYFLCSLSFFPALQALSGSAANPPAHGPEPHRIPLTLHSLSALLPLLPLVLPCSAGSQLSVALLPIRLRMDQNHIEFLSRFTPSLLYFLRSLSFFPALQALMALLPIRLRMDQNHIEFLSRFTPSLLYFLCSLSFFPALQALSGSAANPPAHGPEPHRIPLTLHSLSALLPLLPLVLPCSAGSQLSVALLPIRLRMDQNHIEFLSRFFSTAGAATAGTCASETASAAASAAAPAVMADAELLRDALLPFFQVCEIRAFSVLIDYVPRRLDLSALSAGNYAHLLNLISWKMDFTKARVVGVQGWGKLGGALLRRLKNNLITGGALMGQWMKDTASPLPPSARSLCVSLGNKHRIPSPKQGVEIDSAEARVVGVQGWDGGVEIDFTKARVVGVQGWDGLGGALISQWAEDICRRQLHRVVKAAGPVSPLWALGAASIQLVLLPVQEYRQNKRLMRGVKRGAIDFLQSLSHELLGVGVTVAAGTHHLLHAPPAARTTCCTHHLLHAAEALGAVFFLQSLSHELLGMGVTVAAATHHLLQAAELALAATNAATTATAGPAAPATAATAMAAAVVKGIPAAAMAPVVGAAEALEETLREVKRT